MENHMRFNIDLFRQSQAAEKAKRQAEYDAMLELVLGEVHPSQFAALPPAPREIEWKASVLGIRIFL